LQKKNNYEICLRNDLLINMKIMNRR